MIRSATLQDIQRSIGTDDTALQEYLDTVCDRIDTANPDLHAFLPEPDRRRRLHSEAETLETTYPSPSARPALFGIPIGVKDIIHADGFTTRAGSAIPPEVIQGSEATVVTTLRDAGALVLGKTVTTEFAGGAPGLTRNPHNLEHTPGGSSSGSAAAVAAGLCPVALGTQTGGSVIRPAAFCGIVGFKPSFDRIPVEGVLPRSPSLDHVGVFTQDVPGVRTVAKVVCADWSPVGDGSGGRPTLGVPDGPYLDRASADAQSALADQLSTLEDNGYDVKRVEAFSAFDTIDTWWRVVSYGELAAVHEDWFSTYEPFYRTSTAADIREGRTYSGAEITEARENRERVRGDIHRWMDTAGIDLWVCPPAPGPAPRGITSTGDSVMNRPWTYAGVPAITVPAGTVDRLPVGTQLVGRFGTDERLVAWAEPIATALAS